VNKHLAEAQEQMRARMLAEQQELMLARNTPVAERPYTISELMNLHNLSRPTIIELYENEAGVLILENTEEQKGGVRRKRTIRVPPYVFLRVVKRMTVR